MTSHSVIGSCDRYDRAIGMLVPGRDPDDARLMRRRLMRSRACQCWAQQRLAARAQGG